MPPRSTRKSTRKYRKRTSRTKKFTKYNLYRKRSSASQANQIYRLSKRINGVYKKLRDDVDTFTSVPALNDQLLWTTNTQVNSRSVSYAILGSTTWNDVIINTTSTPVLVPDAITIKSIDFFIHWRFTGLTSQTQPAFLRCVFVRFKQNNASLLSNTDVLNDNSDPVYRVMGPLRSGLKDSGFKVLADYKFVMNQTNGHIDRKIKLPGCRFEKGVLAYPKGSTFVVMASYNPNYENLANATEGFVYYKLAYTNVSIATNTR